MVKTKQNYDTNSVEHAREQKIVKANSLIQKSRYSLSVQQQRILLYVISQIRMGDKMFQPCKIDVVKFCEICGIAYNGGKIYQEIKATIKALADQSIWVDTGDDKESLLRWLSESNIDQRNGTITVRLHDSMKPYLLNLNKNFTQYELIWTLQFRCKYSIRLYELIKSIHYNELSELDALYTLTELQTHMDAQNYGYSDFKRRALEPAIEEINQYSDKIVKYEAIRTSKTVSHIRLVVISKNCLDLLKTRTKIENELNRVCITDKTTSQNNATMDSQDCDN